ncbi:MAG TPA: hypothetical protein VNA26_05735, partial [Chitinophagaceae bacterium]|nr:hypothetical protein [Chitinophagaceae bacterium]
KGLVIDETLHYGTIWKDLYPVGSGGHIDLFCRFAGPNTILLAEVTKEEAKNNLVAAIDYERLEENYRILKVVLTRMENLLISFGYLLALS